MMKIVGLMSGTSLDGVDAALVEIHGTGTTLTCELLDCITSEFCDEFRQKLKYAMDETAPNLKQICSLNVELGYVFAQAVKEVCAKNKLSLHDLDLIGSHGQTLYHYVTPEIGDFASTFQIGEPSVIAYECQTPVVSNFRSMDISAGGQGAPLVPYSEFLLYRGEKGRLLQNIGGIGNVTVLPPMATLQQVFAFDTGPGNMIIDACMQVLFGQPYDDKGEIAASGTVDNDVLSELMMHPYFALKSPKSTGREQFGQQYVDELLAKNTHLAAVDIIATVTAFTAETIAFHYHRDIFPYYDIDEVVIGGGGSYNPTLLQMLQARIGNQAKVVTNEMIGFDSNAKEAVAFAVLANETWHQTPSNVPSATGANAYVVLGSVTYKPKKEDI
ncbi:MAG: anhydro-N-acetylmuramic acid kinase AnmK [Culicoidibacterales bacterium]